MASSSFSSPGGDGHFHPPLSSSPAPSPPVNMGLRHRRVSSLTIQPLSRSYISGAVAQGSPPPPTALANDYPDFAGSPTHVRSQSLALSNLDFPSPPHPPSAKRTYPAHLSLAGALTLEDPLLHPPSSFAAAFTASPRVLSPYHGPSDAAPWPSDSPRGLDVDGGKSGSESSPLLPTILSLSASHPGRAYGSNASADPAIGPSLSGAPIARTLSERLSNTRRCISHRLFHFSWRPRKIPNWKERLREETVTTAKCLPAVILGLTLNLLDAVSYGMIIFPLSIPAFASFGPDGISMFLASAVISQVCYSGGLSVFGGSNGNMMIEVMPFLHLIAETLRRGVDADTSIADPATTLVATTMVAYALSTILTGLVFLFLGHFKLGSLVEFFPRHILVGCIGGVGYFLLQTGLEVTTHLTLPLAWSSVTTLFSLPAFPLWFSSLLLALLLRALLLRIHHPMFVPCFFLAIPVVFLIGAVISPFSLQDLRDAGWIFPLPRPSVPFYDFWTKYDLSHTQWSLIPSTIPAMFALTFFGILHVPINVPALGVSTGIAVDTNRELLAHGWSNLLAGAFGTIQNYLVYSNSVLFIRSGGNSRRAGLLLALVTFGAFLSGPWIVGYIPIVVVGALIFHLGIELLKEAVYDTRHSLHPIEYITVWLIVIAMAFLGFTEGILLGVIAACLFFVILYSRRRAVRFSCSGRGLRSMVKRPYRQGRFLEEASIQIRIIQLQGFLFFGTIGGVEREVGRVIAQGDAHGDAAAAGTGTGVRYLILDFRLVSGVDFSAAEAFIRTRRFLAEHDVYLVLCGVEAHTDVGKSLSYSGIWSETSDSDHPIAVFPSLNEALEACENALLEHYYWQRQEALHPAHLSSQGGAGRAVTFSPSTPANPHDLSGGAASGSIPIARSSDVTPFRSARRVNSGLTISDGEESGESGEEREDLPPNAYPSPSLPGVSSLGVTPRTAHLNRAAFMVLSGSDGKKPSRRSGPYSPDGPLEDVSDPATTTTSPSPGHRPAASPSSTSTESLSTTGGRSGRRPPHAPAPTAFSLSRSGGVLIDSERSGRFANLPQPLSILMHSFQELGGGGKEGILHRMSLYFEERSLHAGHVLWREGDEGDSLVLVERGILRSSIGLEGVIRIVETVLPGTICGEMDVFTGGRPRPVSMVAMEDTILWVLDSEAWARAKVEDPSTALEFMSLTLGYTAQGMETLLSHAIHHQV